jgi:catalase
LVFHTGIAVSNDPVLQTRVMAYADTQRYRLGVNYQLLPANIPKCPFHNNHHDGAMNFTVRDEEVRTCNAFGCMCP